MVSKELTGQLKHGCFFGTLLSYSLHQVENIIDLLMAFINCLDILACTISG